LIVAIKRKLKNVKRGQPSEVTVPSFSFSPNDGLAELIIEAWTNDDFRKQLLKRDPSDPKKPTAGAVQLATASVNARGFNLKRAVVISEEEHDTDWTMQDDNEVVFVLPNDTRLMTPFTSTGSLLSTARLLMACTPNGI